MKKRQVEPCRSRRGTRKPRISEGAWESISTFVRFVLVWILVLLLDFILEFRFEYLWPCWLFFGSVYTTFLCHGPVICVVFVFAAFTLDLFCLIFVPLHWLFFAASTYVLFTYLWHTEKGLCVSTVSLWILLLYTEASLRFKDVLTSQVNLSHLFAAHCISYPVVYLGFDATCYFTSAFKQRVQKAVQSDNDFHTQLLLHSLPPGLQLYPLCVMDCSESERWNSQYQCVPAEPDQSLQDDRPASPQQKPIEGVSKESPAHPKAPSPKIRPTLATRIDRKQKITPKTTSPSREAENRRLCSEQVNRLEQELHRLQEELHQSRQNEQELRSHICNLTNSERSLRPETALLKHTNELLQNKIVCVMKSKQKDKQVNAVLERKLKVETELRMTAEKQLADIHTRKLDEIAHASLLSTNSRQEQTELLTLKRRVKELDTEYRELQMESRGKEGQIIALENEVEVLLRYKGADQDADMLLSALSAMQDKSQHLEYNLSAETRIKLDLFSALGDVRRQLEIAQGRVMKLDQEIVEMKKKMAEVMAVMPGLTFSSPHPIMPQITKFLRSESCAFNRNAFTYRCLKK